MVSSGEDSEIHKALEDQPEISDMDEGIIERSEYTGYTEHQFA